VLAFIVTTSKCRHKGYWCNFNFGNSIPLGFPSRHPARILDGSAPLQRATEPSLALKNGSANEEFMRTHGAELRRGSVLGFELDSNFNQLTGTAMPLFVGRAIRAAIRILRKTLRIVASGGIADWKDEDISTLGPLRPEDGPNRIAYLLVRATECCGSGTSCTGFRKQLFGHEQIAESDGPYDDHGEER
jgi:hypothetical protein